ncbi:sigma-70 family RNA polymerase sigma factor [Pontibacillus yanchengensis]|uniref:Sigma-70 family RNA polymerase sigma factor n=2 Tax=Pontibacillus yanchengensis TaxID=462910 RepID=A0A6I5A1I3_9BACI|nr:sigma-70 family RNA polymerase sigma factor [Pontibacillus yanchengensis]MYL34283.1 sigma-70 family RNA polymerase sigma factor [Pontibacillus yanchengensis]MYL55514.1 sigma-70 family RNA polymerase sigma factor [Pontibacillus yanchengensis]
MKQANLIKKAKKGYEEAFEELLMLHSEQMYRTAFLYTGNREDALDVVQETSFKAYRNLKKLRNDKYFTTWLIRILINTAYEVNRKQKKSVATEDIGEIFSMNDPDVKYMDLVEAIKHLSKNYRDAITLFYFHDLPIKDVAQTMEIPENTVKTYLQRGKKELKEKIEGKDYHERKVIQRKV